jgi:hypothetical protein
MRGIPLLVVLLAACSHAGKPPAGVVEAKAAAAKPGAPRWAVLAQPARWVLHGPSDSGEPVPDLVIETYDIRTVGGAQVARLRWSEDGQPYPSAPVTQIAVTAAGAFFLDAGADDAAVTAALAGKPSITDPLQPMPASTSADGRYLEVRQEDVVCIGEGPPPDAGDCEDV